MYTNFFRLNEPPFSLTPDPRYLYMSEKHREGLAHLLFGVQQPGGFVQLTGEIGCGKTTLCRCLVSQLPPETDIALILNPRLTVIELLAAFCDELRIPYPDGTESVKFLIDAINNHLLQSHAEGRRTVLVIDEAQNLHRDVLEQIRLLTNLETEQEKLLQIILIGQPELNTILKDPGLRQLAQRITARYHLLPLSRQETAAYIQHRLFVAGLNDPIFTKQATNETYGITGGVPRLINIICDRALLGAYTLDKRRINKSIIRKAAKEIRIPGIRHRNRRLVHTCVVITLLILLGAFVYTFDLLDVNRLIRDTSETTSLDSIAESDNNNTIYTDPDSDSDGDSESGAQSTSLRTASEPSKVFEGENLPSASGTSSMVRFEDIITSSEQGNSLSTSFDTLYSLWGIPVQIEPGQMGCSAGESYGYRCRFMSGDWLRIRRLDVPVIMSLRLPSTETRYLTLVGLNGNRATVFIESSTYSFPIQDIDRFWDGSLILIWKPPFDSLMLVQGMQGKEIGWVRQTLDAYEGKPKDPNPSELYDEDLRERIIFFQKTQFLIPDGRIGPETLLKLSIALDRSHTPLLSQYAIKGENL